MFFSYKIDDITLPNTNSKTFRIKCLKAVDDINLFKFNIIYGQIFTHKDNFLECVKLNPLSVIKDHDFIVEGLIIQFHEGNRNGKIGALLVWVSFNENSFLYKKAKDILYKCKLELVSNEDEIIAFGLILPKYYKL